MANAIDILLVDDDPADVLLTKRAFADQQLAKRIHVVSDGEEALAYLRDESHAIPDLILLDLNMPKLDGRHVLAAIKQDQRLKSIPVVVLTTSDADEDIKKVYDLHANCYITKPVELDQFNHVVKSIEQYWVSIATLPTVH